jgi:hypothetical protein
VRADVGFRLCTLGVGGMPSVQTNPARTILFSIFYFCIHTVVVLSQGNLHDFDFFFFFGPFLGFPEIAQYCCTPGNDARNTL